MAFNPNNYKAPEAKKLPVILLLDVSGSMSGAKIDSLYDATIDMIETFVTAQAKEQIIDVAIITFGDKVELHTRYTHVKDLQAKGISKFKASGMTPMGTALRMAKDMIDDKQETPSRIYRPAVVLVSDGAPNDDWKGAMNKFITDGRSAKCQRFAVAIGNDADRDVLEKFTQDPNTVLFAEDSRDIAEQFKTISMSVSTRATSQNPNSVPTPTNIPKFDNNTANDTDDDDDLY
ncbi:MAG: VWA domain-containing protein [bacterium]|nr:VWA domain-containing protein [bacterium]